MYGRFAADRGSEAERGGADTRHRAASGAGGRHRRTRGGGDAPDGEPAAAAGLYGGRLSRHPSGHRVPPRFDPAAVVGDPGPGGGGRPAVLEEKEKQ